MSHSGRSPLSIRLQPSHQTIQTGSTNLNNAGYSNPDVDKAINTAGASLDQGVRVTQYRTVQQAFVNDLPHVFVTRLPLSWYFKSSKVQDFSIYQDGNPRWDRIWINK